jgi:hypothetical protein
VRRDAERDDRLLVVGQPRQQPPARQHAPHPAQRAPFCLMSSFFVLPCCFSSSSFGFLIRKTLLFEFPSFFSSPSIFVQGLLGPGQGPPKPPKAGTTRMATLVSLPELECGHVSYPCCSNMQYARGSGAGGWERT